MTRREEIAKATKEYKEDYVGLGRHLTTDDIADAFEEGAEWADKTMYERIIKWLFDYCPSTARDSEFTIQNLKNAMEG